MPKTQAPSKISISGVDTFVTNAVPDPFDERDLLYRPRLEPLEACLDMRNDEKKHLFVLNQKGTDSCTGHAVASLINTVLQRKVSAYMLYYFARRYDEFEGEEDLGSSLRGAFKGWFYRGVALEADWKSLEPPVGLDLESPSFVRKCRERPLGAFYRVNAYRLDDMQSAISELGAIAVSAAIHNGWRDLAEMKRGKETLIVISQSKDPQPLGGHAFALVGYNEVGFLVQNSWGPNWGRGGYATLPYEDWLENAYDAWVARPGVPQTPFYSGHTHTATATGGALATAPGPDLQRLKAHVINLGNNGQLSTLGRFHSSPRQIDGIFQNIERWHDLWLNRPAAPAKRHVVLYAHGGMVTESNGLESAQGHLDWWLNNQVYPLYFVWESGPGETLFSYVEDIVKSKLPVGAVGFDLFEQFDRLIEKKIAPTARWLWEEMKENARAASDPIKAPKQVDWRLGPKAESAMQDMPGASLVITRLAQYIARHGQDNVAVHLVGHSAGSIFHAAMLQSLAEARIQVDSMAFLAPALRVDEFRDKVVPHIGKTVTRFANFVLSDQRELDDAVLPKPGLALYHKSILYLLSRGVEVPASNGALKDRPYEVPMLGMEKFYTPPPDQLPGTDEPTLKAEIEQRGGHVISSPSTTTAPDSRSDATMHTDFDTNSATMTSVMMRLLNVQEPQPQYGYPALVPLVPADPNGAPTVSQQQLSGVRQAARKTKAKVSAAPRTATPIMGVLQSEGWKTAAEKSRSAKKKR